MGEVARHAAALLEPDVHVECFSGADALLERLAPGALPDIVLLGWQRADPSALELCRLLRRRHDDISLPVLMVTVREGFTEGLAAGANDCVATPCDGAELKARVRTLVRLSQLGRAQSTHLAALFDQAPAFIAHVSGPHHVFDMANAAYLGIVGHRPLLGRTVREALPELEGQPFFGLLDRVYATGEPYAANEMPLRLDRERNGAFSDIFVNFVYQPTRGPDGQVNGILAHGVEVTELVWARQRAEEAQRAQAGLLEALAAQPLVFVALVRGPDLVFEMANSGYAELMGGRKLVGRPLLEAVPELTGQGFDTLLTQVMKTGQPFIGREMPARLSRRNDGTLQELLFNFVYQPVRGPSGTFDGVLVAGIEVTEEVRVRQEAQQRLAFEQRLIGIVGHDLRSPLSAVRMSASQLSPGGSLHEGLRPAQARAVERVDRGARRIQSVIMSLLDLTRARSERGFPVMPGPVDLDVTVRQALEEVRAIHPQGQVHYEHRGDTRGCFDGGRLAQVTVNLLENALRYGAPDSPVRLLCEGDASTLRLSVHNMGRPIPPELISQLFQPFVRGAQSVDTVRESMGLGLYIVREIIRAHGGRIDVTSTEAEGTTFQVELPRG
jgi:signal transduction histidine kinase